MSDNSRITIILAVAMTLAVVLSVLLFVYLFYRAQTKRFQDVEVLSKSHQTAIIPDKPLPPLPSLPVMPRAEAPPQPAHHEGMDRRSSPVLSQPRQAASNKNRTLPFRALQLDRRVDEQREPPTPSNQHEPEKEAEDISIGFSPDVRAVPFDSRPHTPLGPRLSTHAFAKVRDTKLREAKLRDAKRQPPIELHPAFESVPEEHSPEIQNATMAGNRF